MNSISCARDRSSSGKYAHSLFHGACRTSQRVPQSKVPRLEWELRSQWSTLCAEINRVWLRISCEPHAQIAGPVHDAADEAFANLLVDMNFAEVARGIGRVRDLEAAVKRITSGTYGVCARCGGDIPDERLCVYPVATRCTACQRNHEHTYAPSPTPTF